MPAPKLVEIWADTRGTGTCRSCGERLTWAEMVASGKRMPFDGEVVAVETRHDPATHRLIERVDLNDNHWASCPGAHLFRRARR